VNPPGKSREIRVERAHDNTGMCGVLDVKTYEMTAIERHNGLSGARREFQHVEVGHRSAAVTDFPHRHYIMIQALQFNSDRFRQVFVRIEPRHVRPLRARGSARRARHDEVVRTPTR